MITVGRPPGSEAVHPGGRVGMLDLAMRDLEIPAVDGLPLAASWFPAEAASSRATVVVCSATGVLRRYYRAFARHLSSLGFDVVTFDYRGVGGSRPSSLRGFDATLTDWAVKDIEGVLNHVEARRPTQPVLHVGHSVGGQAIGLVPSAAKVSASVLVTTQSAYWRHWRGLGRWRMWTLWHLFVPALTRLCGYFPAKSIRFCEDLPLGAALEWAFWGRHRDYLLRVPGRSATYAGLRQPILAFSFTDDHYAPESSVTDMLSRFSGASCEHRRLAPRDIGADAIGHFGFFRERFADNLWPIAGDWLLRKT